MDCSLRLDDEAGRPALRVRLCKSRSIHQSQMALPRPS